jgi:hypothetical protein
MRAKLLRETDPSFDVFVGPVGQWLCWDPEAYKTGRVEYMEEELNQLMSEKQKNEGNAKTAFEQRVKETKKKAIEENIKNAEKSGNVLTQTVDDDGNLIGIVNAKHSGAENVSYAIKTTYLLNLFDLMPTSPKLQTISGVSGKSLTEQVKTLKKFTYIIEVN